MKRWVWLGIWLWLAGTLGAQPAPVQPRDDGISWTIKDLEVSVTDRRGVPIPGLDKNDFTVLENGERRPLVSVVPVQARHIMALIDLPSSPPEDRHRALPALGDFLQSRVRRGDLVTVAGLRAKGSGTQVHCETCTEPAEVARALDKIKRHRGAGFQAHRHRRTDSRRDLRDAYGALSEALNLGRYDGRPSTVLYLGRALGAGLGTQGRQQARVIRATEPQVGDTSEFTGSVQYLVSLPRSGPWVSKARGEGDRLLSMALETEVTVFPLVPGESLDTGSESWLASETGGRSLAIHRLRGDLERLGLQLDQAYVLSFQAPEVEQPRFHDLRTQVTALPSGAVTHHLRGYHAVDRDRRLEGLAKELGRHRSGSRARRDALDLSADLISHRQGTEDLVLVLPAPADQGTLTLSLAVPTADGLSHRRRSLPYQRQGEQPLRLRIPLRLPAGTDALGLALRDDSTGRVSALRLSKKSDPD